MSKYPKWLGLSVIAFTFVVAGAVAQAQQPKKISTIGYLSSASAASTLFRTEPFQRGLQALGYVEGKNIVIEYRYAEGKVNRLPALAAELVHLKVDVIVTAGPVNTRAAKQATNTILIVMTQDPDPIGSGFVANLARPGGNVTGVSTLSFDLISKRLEVLKDAVPRLARVGLLWRGASTTALDGQLKELRAGAVALKLKLEEIETQFDAKGLESAFKTAKQKQVGAIMTTGAPLSLAERKRLVELAVRHRLPAIYSQKEYVDEGGLMFYGVDYDDLYRRAAVYVDRILKGAKPADLPVQQATKFEFVINLKAAKQIGLTIPIRVLERANQVIK
jgi:ABC-type uncharacterized transport system substrate-binding protein